MLLFVWCCSTIPPSIYLSTLHCLVHQFLLLTIPPPPELEPNISIHPSIHPFVSVQQQQVQATDELVRRETKRTTLWTSPTIIIPGHTHTITLKILTLKTLTLKTLTLNSQHSTLNSLTSQNPKATNHTQIFPEPPIRSTSTSTATTTTTYRIGDHLFPSPGKATTS